MTAKIKLNAASGGGSVSLKAPSTTTSNAAVELQLPIADGTNGQYIKTDGSGNLSFGTVSTTDNNTWVKLSSTTISSDVSDVPFTNSITGAFDTYNMYAIVFSQLRPTADSVELRMRVQEGGSTMTSTAYRSRVHSMDGNVSNAGGSKDHLRLNSDALGNNTSGSYIYEDTNGIIYMTNFMANRVWRYYGFHMFGNSANDKNFDNFGGGFGSINETTGVLVYPESGSWSSGTLTLYGIAQ